MLNMTCLHPQRKNANLRTTMMLKQLIYLKKMMNTTIRKNVQGLDRPRRKRANQDLPLRKRRTIKKQRNKPRSTTFFFCFNLLIILRTTANIFQWYLLAKQGYADYLGHKSNTHLSKLDCSQILLDWFDISIKYGLPKRPPKYA